MSASQRPSAPPARASAVAPGNHDGVHRGHQALVAAARERAGADGRVVGLTFDPHPLAILAPDRAKAPLTTPSRRAELLRRAGCNEVVVTHFDEEYAKLSADQWVAQALVAELHARDVIVGADFRFGAGRTGDVAHLESLGRTHEFTVTCVPPVMDDGQPISSSRVRQELSVGDVATAARLLGHVHEVSGTVVVGDRRGRSIGFPTANLQAEPVLLPADGVYAVVARRLDALGAVLRHGVANLGVRPTFGAGRSLEVHLLDFDGELVGARLRIGFVARLRDEQRFESKEPLVAQIARDVEAARAAHAAVDRSVLAWI